MPKKVVAKQTQTEKAYAAVKRAILQGEIPEGIFLSEREMMSRYEVGRTPYREACNRLIHEGLLQSVPHRGYLVPEIRFYAVRDLFEVRLILEGAIAELAALRARDSEIEDLASLVDTPLWDGAGDNRFPAFINANTCFHVRLAQMSRNQELTDLLRQNLERNERLMYIELRSSRFGESDMRTLHGSIVAALRKRDPRAVRQAVLRDIIDAQNAALSFGTQALGLRLSPDGADELEPSPSARRRPGARDRIPRDGAAR